MLSIAARTPDDDHVFGHDKAEYFSSSVEGALTVVAALGIAVATVQQGHVLLEKIERDVRSALPNTAVATHLEPLEAPESFDDVELDRVGANE